VEADELEVEEPEDPEELPDPLEDPGGELVEPLLEDDFDELSDEELPDDELPDDELEESEEEPERESVR